MLFNDEMKPFTNKIDQKLDYLASLATMFRNTDTYSASNKTRILGLNTDISTVLHFTLNVILKLITLLSKNIMYALTVEF